MVGRIAIIPARGGSKRIPEKNIIDFCGKPMIAWTIEAAVNSGRFDRVLVSTDETKIADISIECGAEVPFFRDQFADDYAPVSEATAQALKQAREFWGEEFSEVVQLMPNCPLRTSKDIQLAIDRYERSGDEFQISCFKYGWMNPWWAVKLDKSGRPQRLFADALHTRSQDLPELYCPTGAIWIANSDSLVAHNTFYGPGHEFYPMPWESAVDIDDLSDLEFAKAVYLKTNRT